MRSDEGRTAAGVVTVASPAPAPAAARTAHIITNKFPNDPFSIASQVYGEAVIIDGRLGLANGRVLPKNVDYVITLSGCIMLGIKHPILANNQDVLAAGGMRLRVDGLVVKIDNHSGHYTPSADDALRAMALLCERGLDLSMARCAVRKESQVLLFRMWVQRNAVVPLKNAARRLYRVSH